jgi:hypothetical protein
MRQMAGHGLDAASGLGNMTKSQTEDMFIATIDYTATDIYSAPARTAGFKCRILRDRPDSPYEAFTVALSKQKESEYRSVIAKTIRKLVASHPATNILTIANTGEITDAVLSDTAGVETPVSPHPAIQQFAEGYEGETPSTNTLDQMTRIVEAAIEKAAAYDIEVDETDGTLTFELRLTNGHLVIGELTVRGDLEANVYHDQHPDTNAGIDEIWVMHLPEASAEDLINLF